MEKYKFKVEIQSEAIVVFASSSAYLDNPDLNDIDLIYRGRKEYVLECADEIIYEKIVHMCKAQDTFLPQAKPIITWLEQEGIKYFIAPHAPSV